MTLCAVRRSQIPRAKFIPKVSRNRRSVIPQIPAMALDLFYRNKESNMINKLLGATAMAAVILAVAPASAAHMAGCSGENMMKTESMIDTMADGEGKIMAQKEIAAAQTSMLDGKMGACSMHLSKAMHAGMAK
jgi:hypothetical protein